ncbi:type VII secretion integral membrane protein EccD [Lentzea sp. NPDC058436]|uniref:type VII secretion integral membrane protein EccD n=1 Tax=Lentzea sp. NPDC058436 TaxID=3346499 RepID=UPI003660CAEE
MSVTTPVPAGRTDMCRVTVTSPFGSADLAVPVSAPLAGLLPVLVRHTVPEAEHAAGWVLQRLGSAPLDLECTVDSADLRDGEELYLRPDHDALPELAYDDLPDGVAESVNTRREMWKPRYTQIAFRSAALLAAATLAVVLVGAGTVVPALAMVALALGGAVVAVTKLREPVVASLLAGVAVLFAAAAGVIRGQETSSRFLLAMLGVVLASAAGAAILYTVRRAVSFFGGVLLTAAWLGLLVLLVVTAGLTPLTAAATVVTAAFAVLVGCARFALRMARINGPQLPRTAEELQEDIDPEPAAGVFARARWAAGHVTMFVVPASLAIVAGTGVVLTAPGWAPAVFTGVVGFAVLLRARGFVPAAQRGPVLLAGALVVFALFADLVTSSGPVTSAVLMGVGALVVGALLAASVRLMARRPVPMWRRVGDVLEMVTAVAVLPLLGQLFDLYSFFRGLGG